MSAKRKVEQPTNTILANVSTTKIIQQAKEIFKKDATRKELIYWGIFLHRNSSEKQILDRVQKNSVQSPATFREKK
ncbi:hypothetical protein [Pseudanabaena yagii]|uniref:Transposase n=1 Tax=Pseudanabaena yagii GIHE-NHR1 TaxID=2722753 RepID=A0ABX1LLU2_9CYAN|nr:hypothetical protein [Pseudanabaena yagii]NMF57098.1 hypothetical protein [Pseudanabaena yagii GIHE-NHR1]NMF57888.1 hypothetical protein [Pseudanabaena yagii GIHE-NHR1]